MKRFSIIHIPILSFFSKELYRDVGLNWRGVNFLYLLVLLAVCSVPRIFKLQKGLSHFIENEAPPLVEQVPRITIDEGQVQVDVQQPYYIREPDSNDLLAIIDTTGEVESLVDTGAFFLLSKNKLIQRQSNVEYRIYDLSSVRKFTLDRDIIMGWLKIIRKFFVPVIYPLVVLSSFLFRIVQALIYAIIGLIFASWCRVRLLYGASLRLTVVAVTPCIIIKAIFEATSIQLPISTIALWFLFFLIAMVYLWFGVKACSQTPEQSPMQGGILPENEQRL